MDYPTRESQPLYINQLLELVKQIEAANPGHTVDIIYCVNILSETATAVKETVEYMRSNSIHNVNVAGVEIGNEVYFNFYNQTLNFTDFLIIGIIFMDIMPRNGNSLITRNVC